MDILITIGIRNPEKVALKGRVNLFGDSGWHSACGRGFLPVGTACVVCARLLPELGESEEKLKVLSCYLFPLAPTLC